jgi:signal transduction histidine kinase
MRRLYLQVYVAMLGVLLVMAVLVSVAFMRFDDDRDDRWLDELTTFAEAILPRASAPVEDTRRVITAIAEPLDVDVSLFGPDREPLVQVGRRLRPPPPGAASHWNRRRGPVARLTLRLGDGRILVVEDERDHRPLAGLFAIVALLAVATGIAAYPLARRLTRRLETLRSHVESLGAGNLAQRVPVEGRDEIAGLAAAFNGAAERIEVLVADKNRLLAQTSHELRTPLTRVRMALELLREGPRPELLERVDRDIEELDELIGELLVSSRLEAPEGRLEREPVDLLALATEEAARRDGVQVTGDAPSIEGDPRLLRRLVRNLIENALRHGRAPVEIRIEPAEGGRSTRLTVDDRGPGIPEDQRERIFEPFYRPPGQASAEGGVGLGLALVRQIAVHHGGRIVCAPREGGGTRFTLILPAA